MGPSFRVEIEDFLANKISQKFIWTQYNWTQSYISTQYFGGLLLHGS